MPSTLQTSPPRCVTTAGGRSPNGRGGQPSTDLYCEIRLFPAVFRPRYSDRESGDSRDATMVFPWRMRPGRAVSVGCLLNYPVGVLRLYVFVLPYPDPR